MTRARDYSVSGLSGGANAASNVTLAILQPFLTTANVSEFGGNLYFSDTRVFANIKLSSIDDLLDVNVKIAGNVYAIVGQALVWDASNTWVPGTVSANANAIIASVSSSLTTANVIEVAGNLYYTNARARTALTASDPTIIIDWVAGTIRANIAALTAASGTTDSVSEGFTNKYYSNARVREFLGQSNLSIIGDVRYNSGDAGLNQVGQTLVWANVGTTYAWIPGSPTVTSSDSSNSAEIANVVRTIGNFTTANLAEAASNLYYTNARARTAFTPLDSTILIDWTTGTIAANVSAISGAAQQSVNFATFSGTANVALVADRANTVLFANTAANATYADAARYAANAGFADVAYTALFAPAATTAAQVLTLSNFTTSNLAEGDNLYYTNQRVYANVSNMYLDTLYDVNTRVANAGEVLVYNGTIWVPGTVIANAVYAVFAERSNVANSVLTIDNFTTTNLREGSNLYYTTTRLSNDIQAAINGKDIILNDLILRDDLTVQGNTFLTSTANNFFRGRQITLAYQAASAAAAEGSGIVVQGANAQMTYSQANDGFIFNKDITINGNIIPGISDRFAIGSATKQWLEVYLGAQTLFIGNTSVSSGAGGGLSVTDEFGNAAAIQLANVGATQYVTVDRVYSNVFPLVEFNSYIGGNVLQFVSNTTGNLYFGIFKSGDLNKFAGMRVTEVREGSGNVRSDLYFYNDQEGVSNSTVRMGLIGTGNIAFTGNLISINNVRTIDSFGSFVGNAYYGARLIDWDRGGTGANSTQRARNNLFSDMTGGLVAKVFASNTLTPVSILGGTGVSIADGSAQSGSPTISIGQNVATTASVTFRDLTLSGNLYVFGNIAAIYSNTLVVNDPMIQLGHGNPTDNFDLGFIGHYNDGSLERHAGLFRDHTDKTFKFFDNLTSEPGLNDIDTANVTFRYANVAAQTFVGNLTGYVSTLNNHTTAALAEGANNLYYTNARVVSAVTPLLTTANVIETSANLYFTNARVLAAIETLSTANIIEASSNLYFTNARVLAAIGTLSTANIIEASSNLYFTNARVLAAIGALSTANIIEASSNLYFTNARVLSALAGASSITFSNVVVTSLLTVENTSANTITANTLSVLGNVIIGSGVAGTLSGLAYLYATNVIANVLFANTIAPTRITGNLVVDNKIFANGLILQNIDVTDTVISGNITGGGGSIFNTVQANSITAAALNITSNIITLLSGVVGASTSNASISVNRGTNADVALRWEEEIDRWQFTNDGYVYYNLPTPSEYDNVIYDVSVQTSNVGYSANLRLTGTKSNGNVLVVDEVTVKGTGLVRVSKQDNDTIVVDAGVAPIIVTGIDTAGSYELTRFRTDLYRTSKYIYTTTTTAYFVGGPEFAAGELLLLHNGSNVYLTQYGMLVSTGDGDEIVRFSANINNGNVILYGQAVLSGTNATVKLTGTTYTDV
jgi:hypothetical protein